MNSEKQNALSIRLAELRLALGTNSPFHLAKRAGTAFCERATAGGRADGTAGIFRLMMWGEEISISFPEFIAFKTDTGKEIHLLDQALLAYYFTISDGTPLTGKWISFGELPDGRFYAQAFQGYTGEVLGRTFAANLDLFTAAAEASGGQPASLGDRAYTFRVLPNVAVLAVAWLGDEDFPTRYQILLDSNSSHQLTTDACAIVGSSLTRRLCKRMELIV